MKLYTASAILNRAGAGIDGRLTVRLLHVIMHTDCVHVRANLRSKSARSIAQRVCTASTRRGHSSDGE